MSNTAVQKLLNMKEQIEEAKTKKAQTEGRLQILTDQMERDFDVKDVKAAKKMLITMEEELDSTQHQIEGGVKQLEEAYDWNS